MPAGQRPLVRRRLRTELRQERERAGKSQAEVARKMDWSPSKIIRLEAGQVGVSTNDLKALLDLYDVRDESRRTFFIELARASRQQSAWWTAYRDIVPSGDYFDFLGYENDAASLSYFSINVIPGLLQIEDYTREAYNASAETLSEDLIDRLVQLRMARKQHVMDRDDPPNLSAVIDEGALRREVGGPDIMADQLTSIAELAVLDNVTIRILPFSEGAHPGMTGPFEILDFPEAADTPVLQFDAAPRDVVLRENSEVLKRYQQSFHRLSEMSLPEEDSVRLINEIANNMTEGIDYSE